MRFYESASTLTAEQDQFEKDIEAFVRGEINPVKFKAIRVAHGVYEQRQNDTYMIRIRCAAGGITPEQLKRTADLGASFGSGDVHFTTRQEVQVHNVLIENLMAVIRGLSEVGLSSRGGGGNTIRNILTPADSGINLEGVFDVDPYAVALTTRMIKEADSWNLPRKFKIAFSDHDGDVAISQATDLGFVAVDQNGQKGFRVFCAGGMGAKPMVGRELLSFIPQDQVYHVTKALKLMFDKHGNRRSKFSSRIKFLWKKLERDEFLKLFHAEYEPIKGDASLALTLEPIENNANPTNLTPEYVSGHDFDIWKKRYVSAQKQDGLCTIKLPLCLGDLILKDAHALCDFLAHFTPNSIRCDRDQNMRLRNIPEAYLGNAYQVITGLSYTLVEKAAFIGNMINCTGAQTCKLGICLPRGLSSAITDLLGGTDLDLDAIPNFKLNMSGCPNTCGMHHIADLGFFGKVGRQEGDMYPAYNVLAGAVRGAGITKYAERLGEIPAHHIPKFTYDFLSVWIEKKKKKVYPSYLEFLESEGKDFIKKLCLKYKEVPSYETEPKYYTDFGAKRRLSLDEIGTAECSAGVFDMIDVDKKNIKKSLKAIQNDIEGEALQEAVYRILFSASRMLLVTRGLDAKTEEQVFKLFQKHFIQTGLISESFSLVVLLGENQDKETIIKYQDTVLELAEAVQALYKNMDDSLRFKTDSGDVIKQIKPFENKSEVLEKDFRGVACPMNFVKTKLVLETLEKGKQLRIFLDDGEPIQNVPNSVKLEGHKIIATQQVGNYWDVLIEKN